MKTIDRKSVMELSNKIQTLLDALSKTEGVTLTMKGGRFLSDSFTLQLEGRLLTESGDTFISDYTNSSADRRAERDGITFTSPHFIGSVWRSAAGQLVKVEEYATKNRRYPYVCSVYEEDRRIKTTASFFKSSTEVPLPSTDTFLIWFTMDVEDDRITKAEEEMCDTVTDYLSVRFDKSEYLDEFFECCSAYYNKHLMKSKSHTEKVASLSADIYSLLIIDNNIKGALECLKKAL